MKKILTVIALVVCSMINFNLTSVFASTYTGCSQWRIPINPWNGNQILPNSSQRYVNLGGVDMSCADLSGIDFYGVVLVNNRFDNSNLSNTNWGGSSYCGMYFLNVDVTGSNLPSHGTWNCSYGRSVYIPTTTTTRPPTTTTTTTTRPPTTTTTTTTRPPTTTTTTTTRPPTTTTTTTTTRPPTTTIVITTTTTRPPTTVIPVVTTFLPPIIIQSTTTSVPPFTVTTSTLPPIPSQDFDEIVAVISNPISTSDQIQDAIIQLDESSITPDQADIIEQAVENNPSIPTDTGDLINEIIKTVVVPDYDSIPEKNNSFVEDVIGYDSKLALLYSFIAFLLFLLINNSIKYNQIYKYGHKTWLQKLRNKK